MGRSSVSCFKIIACGSDSADNDDTHQVPEHKSDKRGWSFRKKSTNHRVLNNIVQTPSSLNKEIPEIVASNLQTQPKQTFTEKTSAVAWTEETPQPTAAISKVSVTTVTSEHEKLNDVSLDESVIVVIQAAIRGFLAKRQMLRLRNVVKLQATARGHLVRNHAVGTLRCVQAIVKMQGLVRAHQARISSEAKPLDKVTSVTKPHVGYISIEKLLSNKFAHQLLESTPRTAPINIKCDPSSRSDSAWNWLERWMLVLSKEADLKSPSETCVSTDAKADNVQTAVTDQNSVTSDSNSFSKSDDVDTSQTAISDALIAKEITPELISGEIKKPDSVSDIEQEAVSNKPEMEIEQPVKSVKRSASEEVESEGKRFAFGTIKATNPAFIAAQSMFNELSTTPSLARSTSSCKSNSEAISSSVENEITKKEVDVEENSVFHASQVKIGGSECGTELSVTSTLDSPDKSDAETSDAELQIELKKEGNGNSDTIKNLDDKVKVDRDSDISKSISVQPEKLDNFNGADVEESAFLVTTVASELPKLDSKETIEKIDPGVEADQQASVKSSAGASPRSQTTVPEFQGTSSSLVSVKAKRTQSDKSSSNRKTKSSSPGKSSPSNPNQNSSSKNSLDGFPKDPKKSKRRDSFGSGRSDYADQEPRDSSSSNPLPSYMQATESARAKALAHSSPRSSPDVQEKEVYVKKRYSLPGGNGKQGSPRLQHSKSQALQSKKANGHPQERKWQR